MSDQEHDEDQPEAAQPPDSEESGEQKRWRFPTAFTVLALVLLLVWVVLKFNRRSNPIASRTSHNTAIEVAWTLLPVLILVAIAVP